MSESQTVLVVGGTGRTGGRVLAQLLERGVEVRAIVRSPGKVPARVADNPHLNLIEADLLSLPDTELRRHMDGCVAVISCLGHVINFKGIFGPPHDLVARATERLCRAAETLAPTTPIRFILMSSVSVNRPNRADTRRGAFERALLRVLCALVPPAKDNQRAADYLIGRIGPSNPFVEWVAVRPDSLLEGDVTPYELHEGLVSSLFSPGSTNMANVAHFMCELATMDAAWSSWRGKLPVIVNSAKVGAAR